MSVAEAHQIAETLEESIAREIPGLARVDTHLEPLGAPGTAADITERRGEMTSSVQRFAESLPEVAGGGPGDCPLRTRPYRLTPGLSEGIAMV